MHNYQDALEYDQMKYRLASKALGIAHWDMDVVDGDPVNPDNRFTWSQEFRQMLGFADEREFPNILSSWSSRLHPDDHHRVITAFASHMTDRSGKTPYDLEYRLMLKNGDYRHFHAFGATMRDGEGVPLRVAGALADITDKMLLMEEKARAADEYDIMFDAMPIACTLWNKEGEKISCNRAALKLYGASEKEDLLERFFEFSPEYQPCGRLSEEMMYEMIQRAFESGYKGFEWLHLTSDGEHLPCEIILIRVEHKGEYSVAAYKRDLRDYKAAMLRLAEESAKIRSLAHWYKSILDATPFPITVTDANMNWTFVNKAVEDFLGTKLEDMLGKPCSNWNAHICNTEQCGIACAQRGLKHTFFSHQSQSYKVDVEILRTIDNETAGFIEVVQNITEIEEIAKKHAEAEAASHAKSAFLANMSHEIRTPMNSIVGFSELALDGDIPQQTRECLEKIMENSKWLLQIINDTLDIAKIESGKMELEHIPFNLMELFASCRSLVLPKAKEKGIELYFHTEASPGGTLLGDPTRLRQILTNLLSNAVKFTEAGSINAGASLKVVSDAAATVYFEVKDSGIGMTEAQIKRVFEPFVQADTSMTRKYGGTGLGLAISKNIIEMMGGKLSVESTPGLGSSFSFELTFDTTEVVVAPAGMLPERTIERPAFKGEVLVCEDNDANQRVIREHLARVGLRTIMASNGKEGVEALLKRTQSGEKNFDLIFMDIQMPVMDGFEATSKILKLETGIPIIAMTANVMSHDRDLYKKSGMRDCIGKPFTSQELWSCLLKYLNPVGAKAVDERKEQRDDERLLNKMRLYFVRDHQTRFDEIAEAAHEGDMTLARRLVHTLKSNAGMIGATKLQNASEMVENSLASGKIPIDERLLDLLRVELTQVLEDLKPLLNEPAPQAARKAADPEQAAALFERLEAMLANRNPECANLIDAVRAVPGTEKLARQMEEYDFKPALETLSELKKKWRRSNG
jgi:PAS domain S-box-containing protein